jgi:hypothetical protein
VGRFSHGISVGRRRPMAIVKCSECGRAVSDKAAACIGCGAPLTADDRQSAFGREPVHTVTAPLTSAQLRWRLALASLTLVLGVIVADAVGRHPGLPQVAKTLSALLVTTGLVWFIVAILQNVQARR